MNKDNPIKAKLTVKFNRYCSHATFCRVLICCSILLFSIHEQQLGINWTYGQTAPEFRWSLVALNKDPSPGELWQKAEKGGVITPYEWDEYAQRLAADPQKKNLAILAKLATGIGWFREGLYFRAEQVLSSIPTAHPLQEIHLFFLAESLFHQGKYKQANTTFTRLAENSPGSLWSHRARFRDVDLLTLLGDNEGALENLLALIERYPEYPYATAAQLQAADLALKLGRYPLVYQLLSEIEPRSLQDVSAKRARLLLKALENSTTSIYFQKAEKKLKEVKLWRKWKNYEIALQKVRDLLGQLDKKNRVWPDAALEEVRILHKMEHFTKAVKQNEILEKSLPKGHWRRTNLWWKSESLFRLGKVKEAVQTLLKSRNNSRSAGTMARIGMLYFNGGLYEEAERAFKKAVERGEKGDPDLWMPRRLLGWLPFRLGRYEEAAKYFKRRCKSGRGSNHYGHYWWARSIQKLGREKEAVQIYLQLIRRAPYSFYAYLAEDRLTEVGYHPQTSWKREPQGQAPQIIPFPSPIESIAPFAQKYGDLLPLWEMIYGLAFIGETSWARVYLRSLTEENRAYYRSGGARRRKWAFAPRFYLDNRDDSNYGIWGETQAQRAPRSKSWAKGISALRPTVLREKLLTAYRALGEHYYARRAAYYDGRKLTYPEATGEGPEWQRRYPRSFKPLVESSAARYAIDPHLIWALMTVESSHNPWAISRVGARGLMQVMPHTGQLSADRMSWPYFGSPLLFEPEVAIEMAAWYFSELIEQFQGQFPLAMAAYNAGPHRVKIWLEFKKTLPLDELIEEIPYAQAREYAKKVTRHLALYRRIYLGHTGHLYDLRVNPYPRGNINF